MTVASFLFTKVHVIVSPGSTWIVAVVPASEPSEQVISVSDQPVTRHSVIVFEPKSSPETVNTFVFDNVAFGVVVEREAAQARTRRREREVLRSRSAERP